MLWHSVVKQQLIRFRREEIKIKIEFKSTNSNSGHKTLLNSASAVIKFVSAHLCSAYSKRISSEVIPTYDDRRPQTDRMVFNRLWNRDIERKKKLLSLIAWKPVPEWGTYHYTASMFRSDSILRWNNRITLCCRTKRSATK